MTIAGGMVCDDGVLVFADTEVTISSLKLQRPKHWRIQSERLRCVATGAGSEPYLRFALRGIAEHLGAIPDPMRVTHVLKALHDSLLLTYKQINRDPNKQRQDIKIILAAATPEDKPILVKTTGTAIVVSDDYEYIFAGFGSELAAYLTSKTFMGGMPLSLAERLVAYVLREVKEHVPYCGGDSIIYSIGDDGSFRYLNYGEVRDLEGYFTDFEKLIQRLRLKAAELTNPNREFDDILRNFAAEMRLVRRARLLKHRGEVAIDKRRDAQSAKARRRRSSNLGLKRRR